MVRVLEEQLAEARCLLATEQTNHREAINRLGAQHKQSMLEVVYDGLAYGDAKSTYTDTCTRITYISGTSSPGQAAALKENQDKNAKIYSEFLRLQKKLIQLKNYYSR